MASQQLFVAVCFVYFSAMSPGLDCATRSTTDAIRGVGWNGGQGRGFSVRKLSNQPAPQSDESNPHQASLHKNEKFGTVRLLTRTSPEASLPSLRARRSTPPHHVDPSVFVRAVYENYVTPSAVMNGSDLGNLLKDLGIGEVMADTIKPVVHVDSKQAILQQCHTASELLEIFNLTSGLTEKSFERVCPSLIQQITQGCLQPELGTEQPEVSNAVYGWATLAVVGITGISMLAMAAVPTSESRFYASVMQLFVAIAVSSLSGDALLHLLPEALGIHNMLHTHEHSINPLYIILIVVLAVYFFFMFERVMSLCLKGKPHGHGHVHTRPKRETFDCGKSSEIVEVTLVEDRTDNVKEQMEFLKIADEKENQQDASQKTIYGLSTLVVMILVGDIVHNITDGLTIGVSFANGQLSGISTSIAVLFHEIPHEIGDFAVMLRAGVPFKKAMLCSLISNLLGFVGLYAGLYLGSENSLQRWVFAATAGMFLYIALVSLIPEMNQQAEETSSPWMVLLRHNIGLLTGWFIMLAIGYYEQHTESNGS